MGTDGLSSLEMTKLHAGGKHKPAKDVTSRKTTHHSSTKGAHKSSRDVFSVKDQKVRMQKNINWTLWDLHTSVNKANSCTEIKMVICS